MWGAATADLSGPSIFKPLQQNEPSHQADIPTCQSSSSHGLFTPLLLTVADFLFGFYLFQLWIFVPPERRGLVSQIMFGFHALVSGSSPQDLSRQPVLQLLMNYEPNRKLPAGMSNNRGSTEQSVSASLHWFPRHV
ncbi:hypothetical protein ATANTOWER_032135 [Ataeniobius toweri]|uniref:Vomeronasal type-1 receptor n=1 Tax=Ataeniobius toweri TaxID=208326 RepID=A0ABU7CFG3_9TELE|nr:hypothetical protein [Ataeniobius toweri]